MIRFVLLLPAVLLASCPADHPTAADPSGLGADTTFPIGTPYQTVIDARGQPCSGYYVGTPGIIQTSEIQVACGVAPAPDVCRAQADNPTSDVYRIRYCDNGAMDGYCQCSPRTDFYFELGNGIDRLIVGTRG